MKILVTGGSGFLGSRVVSMLVEQGHEVYVLVRAESDLSRLAPLLKRIKLLSSEVVFSNAPFQGLSLDAVVHAACLYGRSGEPANQLVEVNVVNSLKILHWAISQNAKFFVNCDSLLPESVSEYALAKKQFRDWLKIKSKSLNIANLKIEYMYGAGDSGDKLFPLVIKRIKAQAPRISLSEGSQMRDFVHVDDVASAILFILDAHEGLGAYSEFQVGGGQLITIRDAVTAIWSHLSRLMPSGCRTSLGFGDIATRRGEPAIIQPDLTALRDLGWSPKINFESGIRQLIAEEGAK